ncbi:DUF6415 family natural product biosynthesis protein [Streptomyces sp. JV178]|uniref:DUF6415 family natural product biosynthesis protein n=1 Tax=Streptomyces sp. JV178 TaxID=858632 RepID=UPI00211EAEF6|nr:DUF6415 family natural product biosynthesis protein [Streptomyces sp. JV178]
MSEVGRELLAILPAVDASDDVVDGWGLAVCTGFDSTRIREAIRAAKSWEQADLYPHPRTLAAVTRALSAYVTTLVPYVSIHLESLSVGSRGWSACGEAIERSQEARDVAPGEGLKAARKHAFRLAVHTEALLRYAKQGCERGGERHGQVLSRGPPSADSPWPGLPTEFGLTPERRTGTRTRSTWLATGSRAQGRRSPRCRCPPAHRLHPRRTRLAALRRVVAHSPTSRPAKWADPDMTTTARTPKE